MAFVSAEVDRSVEARIAGQVGRRVEVSVVALVQRDGVGGQGVGAFRKENVAFVEDVINDAFRVGVRPIGEVRRRVVGVRGSVFDDGVDDDRVAERRGPGRGDVRGGAEFRGIVGDGRVRQGRDAGDEQSAAGTVGGVAGQRDVRRVRGSGFVDVKGAALDRRGVVGDFDVRQGRLTVDEKRGAVLGGVAGKRRAVDDRDAGFVDVNAAAKVGGIVDDDAIFENRGLRNADAAAVTVDFTAGNRQTDKFDRRVGGSGDDVERAALAVGVDRNAVAAVDRDRFVDFEFRSGERKRRARKRFGERNGRAALGELNRFAEGRFAVGRVDDVGVGRNDRRRGFEREDDRFGRGFAVGVDGDDAVLIRRAESENAGRPFGRVGGELLGERPSFAVENFDAITGFVGEVVPSQRRGRGRRSGDGRAKFELRRDVADDKFERFGRGGFAVNVASDDGNDVSRAGVKIACGRRPFERFDFAARLDDFAVRVVNRNDVSVRGFDGEPGNGRGRSGRRIHRRGQTGRSERERAVVFVSAGVDRSVEAVVSGQVGRKRFGNVSVGALIDRLRVFGEGVIAVRRVREERFCRVDFVVDDAVVGRVRPIGVARKRVVGVRGVFFALDVAVDDRVVERRDAVRKVNVRGGAVLRSDVVGERYVAQRQFFDVELFGVETEALIRLVAGNFDVRQLRRDQEQRVAGQVGNKSMVGSVGVEGAAVPLGDVVGNLNVRQGRRNVVKEDAAAVGPRLVAGDFDVRHFDLAAHKAAGRVQTAALARRFAVVGNVVENANVRQRRLALARGFDVAPDVNAAAVNVGVTADYVDVRKGRVSVVDAEAAAESAAAVFGVARVTVDDRQTEERSARIGDDEDHILMVAVDRKFRRAGFVDETANRNFFLHNAQRAAGKRDRSAAEVFGEDDFVAVLGEAERFAERGNAVEEVEVAVFERRNDRRFVLNRKGNGVRRDGGTVGVLRDDAESVRRSEVERAAFPSRFGRFGIADRRRDGRPFAVGAELFDDVDVRAFDGGPGQNRVLRIVVELVFQVGRLRRNVFDDDFDRFGRGFAVSVPSDDAVTISRVDGDVGRPSFGVGGEIVDGFPNGFAVGVLDLKFDAVTGFGGGVIDPSQRRGQGDFVEIGGQVGRLRRDVSDGEFGDVGRGFAVSVPSDDAIAINRVDGDVGRPSFGVGGEIVDGFPNGFAVGVLDLKFDAVTGFGGGVIDPSQRRGQGDFVEIGGQVGRSGRDGSDGKRFGRRDFGFAVVVDGGDFEVVGSAEVERFRRIGRVRDGLRFERDDRRFAVGVDDDLVKRNFISGRVFLGVPSQRRGRRERRINRRGQAGRLRRDVFRRELEGRPIGLAVVVDGGDAVGVSRSEFEFSGRPSLGVGGERFFGRGDPSAVDERFDDVTGFVAGDVGPGQVDRQRFRVQDGRGQIGRRERKLIFVSAGVDRSVEARVPSQVGRNRVGDVRVGALVDRLRTGGEGVIAVFRVRKERLRFVVDVLRRRVGRGVVPSGKARQRVVRVRGSGVGKVAAGVADENRVVNVQRFAAVNAGAVGRYISGNRGVVKRRPRLIVVDVNAAAAIRCSVSGNLDVRKARRSGMEVNAAARALRGVAGNLDVRKPRLSGVEVNAAAVSRRGVSGNLDVRKDRGRVVGDINAAAVGVRCILGNLDVRKGRGRAVSDVNAAAAVISGRLVAGNYNVFKRRFHVGI